MFVCVYMCACVRVCVCALGCGLHACVCVYVCVCVCVLGGWEDGYVCADAIVHVCYTVFILLVTVTYIDDEVKTCMRVVFFFGWPVSPASRTW